MSLLDDARRLAARESLRDCLSENSKGDIAILPICEHCHAYRFVTPNGHYPDCPWLSMPKIVAALEVAERVTIPEVTPLYCCFEPCLSSGPEDASEHHPDCQWLALVDALRGVVKP